jgi:hypothetical protein
MASVIYIIGIYLFLSNSAILGSSMVADYKDFERASKLFYISEVLISSSNETHGGLAEYGENSVKHHKLSLKKLDYLEDNWETVKSDYWKYKDSLGLVIDGRELGNLTEGFKITRYAVCNNEVCTLELYG